MQKQPAQIYHAGCLNTYYPLTTYQHMRSLLREKPVSIYLISFRAATQEG